MPRYLSAFQSALNSHRMKPWLDNRRSLYTFMFAKCRSAFPVNRLLSRPGHWWATREQNWSTRFVSFEGREQSWGHSGLLESSCLSLSFWLQAGRIDWRQCKQKGSGKDWRCFQWSSFRQGRRLVTLFRDRRERQWAHVSQAFQDLQSIYSTRHAHQVILFEDEASQLQATDRGEHYGPSSKSRNLVTIWHTMEFNISVTTLQGIIDWDTRNGSNENAIGRKILRLHQSASWLGYTH